MRLYLDFESRGAEPITSGASKYFAMGARPILVAYAVDDGPVQTDEGDFATFIPLVLQAKELIAHNAAGFDVLCMAVLLESVGRPLPLLERWTCTLARAASYGLPGALAALCTVFALPPELSKQPAGKELINLFCIPNAQGRYVEPHERPDAWEMFRSYAKNDVLAMREIYKRLPKGNDAVERAIWEADTRINQRGVQIDRALCEAVVKRMGIEKARAAKEAADATDGAISPTQVAKIRALAQELGHPLPDLREPTVAKALTNDNLPAALRAILEARLSVAKASTAKYEAALRSVEPDGRIRGSLMYCGARHTGRWSSGGIQLQNAARPSINREQAESAVAALTGPAHVPDVAQVAKDCVRGIVVAAPGHKLVVADYSSIEARVTPWLAGASMDDFRLFDKGLGEDLYKVTYARMFGGKPQDVTKDQRQLGKTCALALGFGGGVGALLTGCEAYGTSVDRVAEQGIERAPPGLRSAAEQSRKFAKGRAAELEPHVHMGLWCVTRMWRQANSEIVDLWDDAHRAWANLCNGSKVQKLGQHLTMDRPHPAWLRLRLPSGRYLMFARPKVTDSGEYEYHGIVPATRRWGPLKTYGGALVQAATQATARDLLADAVVRLERDDRRPIMLVHDEIVCEVPLPSPFAHDALCEMMRAAPSWAKGLPLAAEGWTGDRYGKH